MTRYKITIEYDGTSFSGWQKQKDEVSVEETISDALFKLSGKKVAIYASGRTDAGVHAVAQVAHFDLEKKFEPYQITDGLNNYLRNFDTSITSCEIVDSEFHSRFDAKMRHYQYQIFNRRARSILMKNRAWHIVNILDLEKMIAASKYLIGKHDFTSFRDAECQAKSAIKTLTNIKINKEKEIITIDISAKSFLHHMVRNIVGTLILVGSGKINPEDMKKILEAKDRAKSGSNAPAYGLYLMKVVYTKT